jgi:hypothetical protein
MVLRFIGSSLTRNISPITTLAYCAGNKDVKKFDNTDASSTTNFDSSKYPTCKAGSRPKECNVFNECKDVCGTVNKQNCVTRLVPLSQHPSITLLFRTMIMQQCVTRKGTLDQYLGA